MMSESEVLEKFSQVVAHSLRIEPARVTPGAHLDELGAESLDLIEITMESETVFNIWLPEKSILETAIEVFGPGILEQDGFLTEEGRTLVMRRMPEADAEALVDPVSVESLQRYFMRVGTWVHMIQGLVRHTPRVCTECGGSMAAAPGMRMKCAACGHEVALRSAEEINREWVQDYHDREYSPRLAQAAPLKSTVMNEAV